MRISLRVVVYVSTLVLAESACAVGPLGINWEARELVASGTTDFQDMAGADRYLAFKNGTTLLAYFNQTEQNIDLHWRENDFGPGWAGRAIVGNTRPGGTDPGAFPSLAVSRSGVVAVSYITSDGFAEAWATIATPTGDFAAPWLKEHLYKYDARQTAIAFDSNGKLGLAFHDRISRKLFYHQYAIGSQQTFDQVLAEKVTTTTEDGWWPSLTYYGTAAKIASYNQEQDDVEFQYRLNTGVWQTRVVDREGFTGARPSIAINPQTGRAAIAYYDRDQKDLRFGQELDNGDWVLSTLDSIGNVGEYLSLIFDPTDARPVIAYTDVSNADLKLAWHDGNTWRTQVVDGIDNRVGWTPSIAYARDGRLAIAYMNDETDGGDLYYIQGVPAIPGDFDGNGTVDAGDFPIWQTRFGLPATSSRQGDADADHDVDGNDFLIWQRQLGTRTPSLTQAVPEPTSILILTASVLPFFQFQRCQTRNDYRL